MQGRAAAIIILALATIFALILGSNIALAEYQSLSIYLVFGLVTYFLVRGWRNVWWFTALLVFSGAVFLHAFEFNVDHLFVLMVGLASLVALFHRFSVPHSQVFLRAGSRTLSLITGLAVGYGLLHSMIYYVLPYSANDYSWKTCAKAYFECFATMGCVFWLVTGPYGFRLRGDWAKTLVLIMVVCLFANVVLRAALFIAGFQAADGLGSVGVGFQQGVGFGKFYVPVINMFPGVYTLRNIPPIICVVLFMLATEKGWWSQVGRVMKMVVIIGIGLAFVGAVLSGGRAVPVFCLALLGIAAFVRRQVLVIGVTMVSGLLIVVFANLLQHEINTRAPYYIARSLQFVMIEKGSSYGGIEDSQYVRNQAIQAALDEWKSDDRIMFFGRSVFHITWEEADYVKKRFGNEGFVMNALRSGRTHNMVTDLLLQYGIVGCSLYLLAYIAVIRFIWRLRRCIPADRPSSHALVGAMAVYLPVVFVYQLLGGQFLPAVIPLALGIVRADLVMAHQPATARPLLTPGKLVAGQTSSTT